MSYDGFAGYEPHYQRPVRGPQTTNFGQFGQRDTDRPVPRLKDALIPSGSESRHGHGEPTLVTPRVQQLMMSSEMKPYLHFELGDTVIFKAWVLRGHWDIVLTCLAFFLMAILCEGLKCYREHLFKRLSFAVQRQVPVLGHQGHHRGQTMDMKEPGTGSSLMGSSVNLRIFSWPHFVQTLLHVFQAILSYTLMFGAMTLNIWLLMSIFVGSGLGYFLFSWRKVSVVHVTESCN